MGTGLTSIVLTERVGLQNKRRDLKPEGRVVLNQKVGLKLKSLVLTIIRGLK